MIGRKLSHYEILEKIGAGGMGDVYRARDTRLERDVAVKLLKTPHLAGEGARERFRREALSLSKLNHPNIQMVFDFDVDPEAGVDFLVTEYVPGVTLSDRIESGGLDEEEVLDLGVQLAEGLAEAHASGIVHRDLKPGNLRVTPNGRLKILDFGLAKLVEAPPESEEDAVATLSRLETQSFVGTPFYMSPEQRAGRPADARSDIYAAGLVLRELLTGSGDDRLELASGVDLSRIIQKCLQRDPAGRYATAGALRDDLRRAAAGRATGAPRRIGAALAALVAIVAVAAVWMTAPSTPDTTGPIDSVVALPSEMVGDGGERYLKDAVPKTISTYLAQVEDLETKLPPASIELERFQGDINRIAATYGVSALVLSSVTRSEDDFFLNLQLVEADSRTILWSGDFQGSFSSYLEVAREAAEALRQQLRPEHAAIAARAGVPGASVAASSQAELAFQSGLYYSNRFNNLHHPEDFDASFRAFQETLELDPAFADAAAEIAWLYEFKLEVGMDPLTSFGEADAWAQRAIDIDSENGRAWAVRAHLEAGQGRLGTSVSLSGLRAVRFAPQFSRAHVALGFGLPGCTLKLEAFREAGRVDPLYIYSPMMAATALACLGRMEEAMEANKRALALEPEFGASLINEPAYLLELGRSDEARAALEILESLAADGRLNPLWVEHRRDALLALEDDPSAAEPAFERLRQTAIGERRFPYWQMFMGAAAGILAHGGRLAEGRELTLLMEEAGIVPPYDALVLSPRRAWIRDDPELQHIVAKSRQRFADALALLQDARARGELPRYLEAPLDELLIDLDMR